jgi:hypothetical protein
MPSLRLVSTSTSARSYKESVCSRGTCPSKVTWSARAYLPNQRFQAAPLRSLARDGAFKAKAARAKLGASSNQESVVLHGVQPAYGKNSESGIRIARSSGRLREIHALANLRSQSRDQDFVRRNRGIALPYMAAIELRNCETESATGQLGVEIGRVQQQIGTVQRHAETASQQSRGDHADPGTKISVVHVDVIDAIIS